MNDQEGKKEDNWVRKLPAIIVALAVLIFMIVAFNSHYQLKKWEAEQSELTGKVEQTGVELDQLKEVSGSLQEATKKVEAQKLQAASMTAALEKLIEEKKSTESALSGLSQELSQADQQLKDLSAQVAAGKNKVAELTKETDTLQRTLALRNKEIEKANAEIEAARSQQEMLLKTVQRLEGDIVNKKGVLDSIEFLQRQIPVLEQKNQDLKTRNELVAKNELEQQAKLDDLQNKINDGATALHAQNELRTALNKELAELTAAVKKLSSQKEDLALLSDRQKKLEYLENLQQQKESMEMEINSLLQRAKMLEEGNLELQQSEPAD